MWKQGTPEEAGIPSSAVSAFVEEINRRKIHIDSFRFVRHNICFAQSWYAPYTPEHKHMMFSLSKSLTSLAVGFAVQDGLLSTDDRLVDFFEAELPQKLDRQMVKITVKNLLTMNTGHDKEPMVCTPLQSKWSTAFLGSKPEHIPGTHFAYNTPATYMLSCIVQKVTGKMLVDYLREKLFVPLGMSEDIWWETSPEGVNTGGFGANLRLDDMTKLGLFLLRNGAWEGKQLLNPGWIRDSIYPWSDNSRNPNAHSEDWQAGYGYQFWLCTAEGAFRADGAFGQFCVVMPKQDMVFVCTAGTPNTAGILKALWKHILPALKEDPLPPASPAETDALSAALNGRSILTPFEERGQEADELRLPDSCRGAYRILSEPYYDIREIRFSADQKTVYFTMNGQVCPIPLNSGHWQPCHFSIRPPETYWPKVWLYHPGMYENGAAKAFMSNGKLYLNIVYPETPYEDEFVFSFLP